MLNRPEPWPAVAPVHHCGRVRVVSQNLPPPLATQRADRVQLRERAKTQTLTAKNQNTNVKSIELHALSKCTVCRLCYCPPDKTLTCNKVTA